MEDGERGWEEREREGNSNHVVSLGLGGHCENRGAEVATVEKPRIDHTVLRSVKSRAGIWSEVSPLSLLTSVKEPFPHSR